jgi:PsbP-like protein
MNKATNFCFGLSLLANMVLFTLVGCGVMTPSIVPTLQSPTAAPPYIHYTPAEGSNIHLEFDYPGSWVFSEELEDRDLMVIGLGDPRLLTVPTRAANEPHGTPSDFGRIRILIEPVRSNQTLDTQIQAYKQGHSDVSWVKALNDHEITIDGYNAIVLEYQIDPFDENGYTSLMFERNIFFAIKDQIYQITFLVAEKERGSEFEKGYEHFFNSLKIVP